MFAAWYRKLYQDIQKIGTFRFLSRLSDDKNFTRTKKSVKPYRRMKTTWVGMGVVCGTLLIAVSTVQAISLAPNTSILLPSEAEPVGASLMDSSVVNFSALTFSGTLTSKVWSNDASNPHGGLTFTYELSNNQSSADPIDRFTLSSYSGFLVDASYFGAGIVPTAVTRNSAGNQISFNFSGVVEGILVQGASSPVLILQTDSTVWQDSIAGVINSSTVNVATFAPLTVPEPTTAALVVLGALTLGLRRKP